MSALDEFAIEVGCCHGLSGGPTGACCGAPKPADDGEEQKLDFAEAVLDSIKVSIESAYISHADKTGGLTFDNITNGSMLMFYFGIVLTQRFPAEAAMLAAALDDGGTTEAAVDDVIALATEEAGK